MIKDKEIVNFGEVVAGYNIRVLNEREIRASAGIMFLLLFLSLMLILFKQDFLLVKYVIVVFLADFMIRVCLNPRFSPLLIIGRWIVSRQTPQYVGAAQKKFAWSIGLALSGFMFLPLVVMNSYSSFTLLTCLVCLLFLFFESAFGICLGCIVYRLMHKTEPLYCAGESCDQNKREGIQKISGLQVLCVAVFVLCLSLVILLFGDRFSESPKSLWDKLHAGYGNAVGTPGNVRLRSASRAASTDKDLYTEDAALSVPLLLR